VLLGKVLTNNANELHLCVIRCCKRKENCGAAKTLYVSPGGRLDGIQRDRTDNGDAHSSSFVEVRESARVYSELAGRL
jgi:hypothetical protein